MSVDDQAGGIRQVAQSWEIGAQQPHEVPRIAFLTTAPPPESEYTHAFIGALADLGRVEGHDIAKSGDGAVAQWNNSPGTRPKSRVDVHRGREQSSGLGRQGRKTIPIVIATMEDPVQQGFATSLAHPGGSITGLNLHTSACRA